MKDSGVEWIGEIPEGWELVRLSSVFSERKEKVSDRDFEPLSVTKQGILPQIEGVAKTDNGDSRKRVSKGDFVINSRSDRKGSSGVSSYDGSVSLINIVLRPTSKVKGGYVHHLLRSYAFQEEFYRWGHGIVADLWTTNSNDAKGILLPLPEAKEQQRIADFLDTQTADIDASIAKTQESIEEYKKLKQAVITQAVTKGIRPGRAMKDSGVEWIGEIPEDWSSIPLRHIGFCQNGISKSGEAFGTGYPFVTYGDTYNNMSLPAVPSGLVQSSEEERRLYSVEVGDILFTRTSETIEEIGFSSVCITPIPDATFAGFLIRVRPVDKRLDHHFSQYYFRSDIHRRFFVKEMNIVTRASLGQGLLKRLPVLLPCKKEQQEIAVYLDEKCAAIDTLIEKKQAIITELEAYKKSLIYEYVTGKKEVPVASC